MLSELDTSPVPELHLFFFRVGKDGIVVFCLVTVFVLQPEDCFLNFLKTSDFRTLADQTKRSTGMGWGKCHVWEWWDQFQLEL